MPPRWICSQLGAREHYAIPRALHGEERLRRLYTDIWARGPWQLARHLGEPGSALAGRWAPGLSDADVQAFSWEGLRWIYQVHRTFGAERWKILVNQCAWFADRVSRSVGSEVPGVFFSYTGSFLETAQVLKDRNFRLVLGQVDPAQTEDDIVAEEERQFPDWQPREAFSPPEFGERRQQEWTLADTIVVNSPWSRTALIDQGVPAAKIEVVPLVYTAPTRRAPDPEPGTGNRAKVLRVLWLGQVILRKGIQYLLEAARLLAGEPVHFTVAGEIKISEEAVRSAPPNVEFIGKVPRLEIGRCLESADIFVLPTLSDGFAITQLEAMAHGVPVVATERCGEVVTEGEDGHLVPAGDAQALAAVLAKLAQDPSVLEPMSRAALEKADQFGPDRLSRALRALETP